MGVVPGMSSDTLLVSEVFGPTVQGEGPNAGHRCAFIRLGLCNLNCSWCDTPYTWDWQGQNGPAQDRAALVAMTPAELLDALAPLLVDHVVISGGEPLVQRNKLGPLVSALKAVGYFVEIETNGTLNPSDELIAGVDWWNVSPKLEHSGVAPGKAKRLDTLSDFYAGGRACFKFVCQRAEDLYEVAALMDSIDADPSAVWIMPEGRDALTITETTATIAPAVIDRGYNLTTRLHVLAWGDRRGV